MQIRLGNRQDEPMIVQLVYDVMREFGLSPNLAGAESDLKNIEESYFAHDGIFLVTENEGQIVGIVGARRSSENVLELVRFAVAKGFRKKGYARRMLSTILTYAVDMGFERIEVEPARQYPAGAGALMKMGFTSENTEDAQEAWYYLLV